MTFNVKIDSRGIRNKLRKFAAVYARETGPALEEIADGIIANIRKRKIWDNETVGTLKKGLWRDEPIVTKSNAIINMGWSGQGAAFGPGHEWGFKKSKWKVAPVNTRVSMMDSARRIGQPIKALRFVVGGRVVYSRGHEVSAPKDLKPHFGPAYDAFPVERRMGQALERAVRRVGLTESEASKIAVRSVSVRSGL